MADRELNNALSSGELNNIQLGGTNIGESVPTSAQVDVKVKATDDKLVGYVKKDGTTTVAKTTYATQTTAPAYNESTSYYKDGVMNIQGGYPDVTLQVGREIHLEIVNNTGATIINGSACRHNGVSGGMVQAVLALADTFINASVLGIATHDILAGQTGILTTYGFIGSLNTTGFPIGVPLFLSDTVPGGFVATAPDIVTVLGGAITQDASTGSVFITIENTINLPTAVTFLQGQNAPSYALSANVVQDITDYTSEISIYNTNDLLAGTMNLVNKGTYEMALTVGGTISDEEVDLTFELYDISNAVVKESFVFNVGRGSNASLIPFTNTFTDTFVSLSPSVLYKLRVSCSTNEQLELTQVNFQLKSLHLT